MTKKERLKKYKDNQESREALFIRAENHPVHRRYIEMVAWRFDLNGIQRVSSWVDELDRRGENA